MLEPVECDQRLAFPVGSFRASSESLPEDSESLREDREPFFFEWSLWKMPLIFGAVVAVLDAIAEEEEGLGMSVDRSGLIETEDIEVILDGKSHSRVSATPRTL